MSSDEDYVPPDEADVPEEIDIDMEIEEHAHAEGYATGCTSGEEDNDNYFQEGVDMNRLLQGMAQPQPGSDSLQPYEVLQQQRKKQRPAAAAKLRRRGRPAADDLDVEEAENWSPAADEANRKKKHRHKGLGTRGPRQIQLPEHVSRMMGHANLLFASGQHQQCSEVLLEVIRQVPNLADPYHTLGSLHETMGRPREALNFFMIAAHMTGKDASLWHRLAVMSDQQGFTRQAIYCWSKVLVKEQDNFEARFARARLYPLVNEPWKAKQQYQLLLDKHPGHPEVVKALVQLYHDYDQTGRAIELLEEQLDKYYSYVDLTHINMLTELYMTMGYYGDAIQLINRSESVICKQEPLPIDLKARRGACHLHMGDVTNAQPDLDQLLAHPVVDQDGETVQDLYILVIQECSKLGLHREALPFMDKLAATPGALQVADDWLMLAECYCKAGELAQAVGMYTHKLEELGFGDKRYLECALQLVQLHAEGGDAATATSLLSQLEDAIAQHLLVLPEGEGQQLTLFLDKALLLLRLGQREAFAESLLPHVTSLLEQAENNAAIIKAANQASASGAIPKELVRALKRRKMFARKGQRKQEAGGEVASVFKGYISKDRRRPHVKEADRAAEQLLRRARAAGAVSGAENTDFEPDEDEAAAVGQKESDNLPAELAALVAAATSDQEDMPDLFGDPKLYGCFIEMVHVLLELGQGEQAAALVTRARAVAAVTVGTKDTPWRGPAVAQKGRRGSGWPSKAGAIDGNISDWGPAAAEASAAAVAADRRNAARQLREGLRLLAAEVEAKKGNTEEAAKMLKTVLPRWPYSWRAWSLYCSCTAQLGRLQHWMKAVAALRAKHPDSLALQVLAAHVDNMSGDHTIASQGYASALMQLPNEPLLLLCLGVAQIDAALARHCKERNTTMLRGFAALHTYARHRGPAAEAEAAYNLGRAAHEVGLLHLAVAHYERVLQLADGAQEKVGAAADQTTQQLAELRIQQQQQGQQGQQGQQQQGQQQQGQQQQGQQQQGQQHPRQAGDGSDEQQRELQQDVMHEQSGKLGRQQNSNQGQLQRLSLHVLREAAHNLSMIYQSSGANELARQIMHRYLTV